MPFAIGLNMGELIGDTSTLGTIPYFFKLISLLTEQH